MTTDAVMSDAALDQLASDLDSGADIQINDAPATKAKPSTSEPRSREAFEDTEYDNEDDQEFDPENATPEQKRAWPKKYANALSRRDKHVTKLKSDVGAVSQENVALKARLAELEGKGKVDNAAAKNAGAKLDNVLDGKPDISKYDDWEAYQEALIEWKANAIAAKAVKDAADVTANQTKEQQHNAAIAANEDRIVKQATELLNSNPDYAQAFQENADILNTYPQEIVDVWGEADNPAVAFLELAKTPGALEALGTMSPAKAAMVIGRAEAAGLASMGAGGNQGGDDGDFFEEEPSKPKAKPVSAAPAPMRTPKAAATTGKAMDDMNADELYKKLGL